METDAEQEAAADVIVIGVGAMGSAACSALARRGLRVLGLEQFDVAASRGEGAAKPFRWGSSGGQSRLVRQAYFEHANYVPLLREAYPLWRALEQRTGQTLMDLNGLLYMGPPKGPLLRGVSASARQFGVTVEPVDNAELARRWPYFVLPAGWDALFEPGAGYVLCEAGIDAMIADAVQHGATIRGGTKVLRWSSSDCGVEVVTAAGVYRAARLVLCAGPWSGALLEGLAVPLKVTRQVLGWMGWSDAATAGTGMGRERMPCWAAEAATDDYVGLYYGMPPMPPGTGGPPGIKCGFHHAGQAVDPATNPATVTDSEVDAFRTGLRRFLPAADGPLLATHACLYTMSADGHFVLGPHPREVNVVIAAGFSGHGFKFAPVVGEVLADYCTEGKTARKVEFLSAARFGRA